MIKKLDSFPAEDGHIESILIGVWDIKVSFQDWKGRKLVLIFKDVEEIHRVDCGEQTILYNDVGEFRVKELESDLKEYCFVGSWNEEAFLNLKAKSLEIYEVGVSKNANTALFLMDLDYIGEQSVDEIVDV